MLLRDIITERIIYLKLGDTLEKVVRSFRHDQIVSIPVLDFEQKLLGIFTRTNLFDALLGGASLQEPIDQYMHNDKIVSLSADMPFDEVSEFVKDTHIGSFPVTEQDGRVIGVLTKSNMVVTLIKQSEMLNTQLKAILASMYNGVIVVNEKGEVSMVNSGAERIFHIAEDCCLGQPLKSVLPDLVLSSALVEGKSNIGLQYRHGKIVTIANITPLINNETIVGAIAIFQDLTDLEQVARELESVKALNKTLDTVLNITYDGIIVIDDRGRITLINRVLSDFLKVSQKKVIGKHISEIMPESRLHNVAKTGIPEMSDIQTIQGQPLIVSSMPITREGRTVGAVGKATFPQFPEIQELADKLAFLQNKITYYQAKLEKTKKPRVILDEIVGKSAIMKNIRTEIVQVAKSTSTVLITGESGTGKELVAQAIHLYSDRRRGPFVKVNCAAIPENLLEAEMFGYAPGAFTGALKNGKQGRFEAADKGTILLDEVGDMPLFLQAKILRVIQEREFERLGDTKTRKVDVRILAATNKDLRKAIEKGTFREDLFYRLNVINFQLPPLREHREDIEVLVDNFIDKYNNILNTNIREISPNAMDMLLSHSWPGNIRELENVIERAVNYARSDTIEDSHLPQYLLSSYNSNTLSDAPKANPGKGSYRSNLAKVEKEMILSALEKAGGNKTKAAELLNLSRSRLYVKMKNYGIMD